MRTVVCLLIICALIYPYKLFAADQPEQPDLPRPSKPFSAGTMKAFDHSGRAVTQSVRADGSRMADHHGTSGHVTMARFGADGSIETYCTTHETVARSWMAGEVGKKPATLPNIGDTEK